MFILSFNSPSLKQNFFQRHLRCKFLHIQHYGTMIKGMIQLKLYIISGKDIYAFPPLCLRIPSINLPYLCVMHYVINVSVDTELSIVDNQNTGPKQYKVPR